MLIGRTGTGWCTYVTAVEVCADQPPYWSDQVPDWARDQRGLGPRRTVVTNALWGVAGTAGLLLAGLVILRGWRPAPHDPSVSVGVVFWLQTILSGLFGAYLALRVVTIKGSFHCDGGWDEAYGEDPGCLASESVGRHAASLWAPILLVIIGWVLISRKRRHALL